MLRDVSFVSAGAALGQLLVLAATPFLARQYSPAEFGQLALLYTVASLAAAAGCLRFDLAVPVARQEEHGPLLVLCLASAAFVALVAGLACLVPWQQWTASPLAALAESPGLVVMTVAAVSVYQLVVSDLVRSGRFRLLGGVRLSQGALFAGLPLLPGVNLVWGLVLSFMPGALGSVRVLRGKPWTGVREVAWKFRRFPLYSLPGALLDVAGTSAAIWIVTTAYGMATAGQYSQVARLLGGPMFLVGAALFQVLLRTASEHARTGRPLVPLVNATAWRLLLGAGLAVLLTALFGEDLLSIVLGPGWRVDTRFLVLVVSAAAIRAAVSPLSSVLVATGRLVPLTAWQATYCATSLLALPLLAARTTFETFLVIFVVHEAILYGAYLFLIQWASRTARQ